MDYFSSQSSQIYLSPEKLTCTKKSENFANLPFLNDKTKGGFKSEGRGGFSQLPKMSAEKTILGLKKNENADFFFAFTGLI